MTIRRIFLVLALLLIALPLFVAGLLYIPCIQRSAVRWSSEWASEETGYQISIQELHLAFPLRIKMGQLSVMTPAGDTLMHAGELSLAPPVAPLIRGRIILPTLLAKELIYNSVDSVKQTTLKVHLPELNAHHIFVNIPDEIIEISSLYTQGANIYYHSSDTTTSPPTPPLRWQIGIDGLQLQDTHLSVTMPHDSLYILANASLLELSDARSDLSCYRFAVGKTHLEAKHLAYATDTNPPKPGILDYKHIELRNLELEGKNIYSQGTKLDLEVTSGAATERSGLSIRSLRGVYNQDEKGFEISNLSLITPQSQIIGQAKVPWSLFKTDKEARAHADLEASLHIEDILRLSGGSEALTAFGRDYAKLQQEQGHDLPGIIDLQIQVDGSLQEMELGTVRAVWADVADLSISGKLQDLDTPAQSQGTLTLEGGMQQHASMLLSLFAPTLSPSYTIPSGVNYRGNLVINRGGHKLNLKLHDRDAQMDVLASYGPTHERYQIKTTIQGIDLRRYIPQDSIGVINADIDIDGRGIDILSPHTSLRAKGRIHQINRGQMSLRDITLDASLSSGAMLLSLNSANVGLNMALQMEGNISRTKGMSTSLNIQGDEVDLYALGLSSTPLNTRFHLNGELKSDFKDTHRLTAQLSGMRLGMGDSELHTDSLQLDAETTPEYINLLGHSGDLDLRLYLVGSATQTSDSFGKISSSLQQELSHILKGETPRTRWEDINNQIPSLIFTLNMGQNNGIKDYLALKGISIKKTHIQLEKGVVEGLKGHIQVQDLWRDTTRIQSATLDIETLSLPRTSTDQREGSQHPTLLPDSMALRLTLAVDKYPYRQQPSFLLRSTAELSLQEGKLIVAMTTPQGTPLHEISLRGAWAGDHYSLSLLGEQIRLSSRPWDIGETRKLTWDKRTQLLSGGIHLTEHGGGVLAIDAQHSDDPAGQLASLQLHNFRLQDYTSLGLPDLKGKLWADINYRRDGGLGSPPSVTGDFSIDSLEYEGKHLGHFAAATFYEPRSNHSHYVTAEVSYAGNPALSIDAVYQPQLASSLNGTLILEHFPLEIINPFLDSYATSVGGKSSGKLLLSGTPTAPHLEGALSTVEGQVKLSEYGMHLQLDTVPLRFANSHVYFDHYALYPTGDYSNPLSLDGSIGLSGRDAMMANLRLSGNELILMDEPQPTEDNQILYGKLIASPQLSLSGPMTSIKVRGRVNILGGTNCTYVMKEQTLSSEQKMSDVVQFIDFTDSVQTETSPKQSYNLGGLDVTLAISVEPSVRFGVNLTADGKDYMKLQGGGELQFTYPPYGEMKLVGNYNMTGGGELSYTLPIMGNKKFSIDPSSYLRWSGAIDNPYLNLLATQRVKANVTTDSGGAQSVNFDVGIRIKDNLESLNLSFELSAPESLTIQNSLANMTAEERGKQAIALMTTGIYMTGKGASTESLNFGNALSSLLQSQINNAAGSLLQGTDLNIGMEMGDGNSQSSTYTNYTYSFSRRFFNDRIRISIGGKVQTGSNSTNQNQTLIDNVSMEYLIDRSGQQSLRLYHKLITDDVLEGQYSETGLGYVLRRKLNKFTDLLPHFLRPTNRRNLGDTIVAPPNTTAQSDSTIIQP